VIRNLTYLINLNHSSESSLLLPPGGSGIAAIRSISCTLIESMLDIGGCFDGDDCLFFFFHSPSSLLYLICSAKVNFST
jgi:hypothetical protein